jgi:hypothetical protein
MIALPFRSVRLATEGRGRVGVGLIRCLFNYGPINNFRYAHGAKRLVSFRRNSCHDSMFPILELNRNY